MYLLYFDNEKVQRFVSYVSSILVFEVQVKPLFWNMSYVPEVITSSEKTNRLNKNKFSRYRFFLSYTKESAESRDVALSTF